MLGISYQTLALYGIVTAIPTLAWLRWEFFKRWKWSRGGLWSKAKELLILATIAGLGFLAAYLASAASDYMTGQTLYLDGGLTL